MTTQTQTEAIGPEERFQNFLKSFQTETGEYKYRERLAQLSVNNSRSLIIDAENLMTFDEAWARSLIENPDEFLKHADKAAFAQLKIEDPEYAEEISAVRVRFRKLPEMKKLRVIGAYDVGNLILIDGILVRASSVKPLLVKAVFKCRRCGETQSIAQTGIFIRTPLGCANPDCRRIGPLDFVEEESTFINFQEVRIQEKPEDLPPGQLPRSIDIRLIEDLVDVVRPGDRVSVTGIVRALQEVVPRRGKLRTFELYLDANYIDTLGKEVEIVQISPEEEKQIKELAADPFVHRTLTRSIAPSIFGYEDVKEAIAYLLFSGVPKVLPDGVMIRGDLNVLLIGDPGTAKSQLLQYVGRIAPRGLYTSGRGTTAAGLTAAVVREKAGGLVLEAGALVLADKGICCIDEFDKMRPEDRVAIHEAMEQQTVSVAKGGIVATLNARASILAAANPALGRYEPSRIVAENINLPITVLSRFDLIFVLIDKPEREMDTKMAEHILRLHESRAPPVEPPISPQLLRKYISYAKRIEPRITDEALKRFEAFYLKMRGTPETGTSPIAITPRQLESLVRLSEARAKAALRQEVTAEDAEAVIKLMEKSLGQVGFDMASQRYDIDIIMTGKSKSTRDKLHEVLSAIMEIEREEGVVELGKLYKKLYTEHQIEQLDADRLINQLIRDGTIYSPKPGYVKKT